MCSPIIRSSSSYNYKEKELAMKNSTEVTLVNGEKVQLMLNSVCNTKQTFVRVSERIIAGIVNEEDWHGIYIWYEVDGVYDRLGDFTLKEQADKSVIWDIYAWTHNSEEFKKRAAEFLGKQGEVHSSGITTGNNMKMLSIPPGIPA